MRRRKTREKKPRPVAKSSHHRSQHDGRDHTALVEDLGAGAHEEQCDDEGTHDDQVALVQAGIPEHGSTHFRGADGGDVPFPVQNVPLGLSASMSAAAKRRLPACKTKTTRKRKRTQTRSKSASPRK